MTARNESLEALIAAAPDKAENYLVYADWLTSQGDPRGELITLQHSASDDKAIGERVQALLAANNRFLPDVDDQLVHIAWRWGFLSSVHFNNDRDWMVDDIDTAGLAKAFFSAPVAQVLEEVQIGILRWDHCETDVPMLIAAAAASPAGKVLRKLSIGSFGEYDVDNGMFCPGQLGQFAFPALETLRIHCSDHSFGGFDLPKLKSLAIETCSFSKAHLETVFSSNWPALERVELWFGSERRQADCTVADLGPILDGTAFPKIEHLGLMNSEFADDLPKALATSKVLSRLKTLDLSRGTMGPDGARALLAAKDAFKHLESISLDENFLHDDDLLDELMAAGLRIRAEDQKDDDDSVEGEIHRYVSLSE
jgi:uncharacterized protein (TIGR02996 family)